MARMIPSSGARDHDPRSREGVVYSSLSLLDEDYTIVHSMSLVSVAAQEVRENEADFILFKADAGIICFEVKAGQISYENGEWLYSDGKPMKHGGPFNQAQNIKFRMIDEIRNKGLSPLVNKCRFYHAVWFPSVSRADINRIDLPGECDRQLILTKDDLENPEPAIQKIFSLNHFREQNLTSNDAQCILNKIICPSFHVVPTARTKYDFDDIVFSRLLESQIHVLDFLQEQRFAVINGVAGSGKTLIAIEQAKRMASLGDRVLFLCYNNLLCQEVKARCAAFDKIDVYTIDAFSCKICGEINYLYLQNCLIDNPTYFPYHHLVIDEGQDFGFCSPSNIVTSKSDLLDTFKLLIEEKPDGTFYMFYDKFQLIQGTMLPAFVGEADCKLTLWVNCRNTANIAKCSIRALDDKIPVTTEESIPAGSVPRLSFSTDVSKQIQDVDLYIRELKSLGIKDIVILTCKTEESSIASNIITGEQGAKKWKRTNIPFHTCRKFKGLEADAVILIDVTPDLWVQYDGDSPYKAKPGLLFYTGASRAKHELRLVCDMNEDDFREVIDIMNVVSKKNPVKSFLRQINALPD